MNDAKPKQIFSQQVRRGVFLRHAFGLLLLILVVAGAYLALLEANRRLAVDTRAVNAGLLVAIILGGLLAVRALYNLWRWLTWRSEALRFFDQGFVWEQGSTSHKYAWHQISTFREGARGVYLFGRWPLVQWGAHTLTMQDGKVFHYTGRFGDTRRFVAAVRRYTTYVTSTHMARALREQQTVHLHPQLIMYPGGLEANDTEIPWNALDVRVQKGWLMVRRRGDNGKFTLVSRYRPHTIDNLGGFLDLAKEIMQTHQPERFRRRAG